MRQGLRRCAAPAFLAITTYLASLVASCSPPAQWQKIDSGLFLGQFSISRYSPLRGQKLTILKIDPLIYQFELLAISELGHNPLTTQQWCRKYKLIGAINAGMYQTDGKTNVGFMKNFAHINNGHVNSSHQSMAAFNPKSANGPPFVIQDLDMVDADSIITRYNTVIQNLRLIKRPGENRWQKQRDRWSEAALGQDLDGNVLFIYCPRPISMHDLNQSLLRLPINIVCAQHLDGGPHASFYFSHNGVTYNYAGSIEITSESQDIIQGIALPNVIGFRKRF